MLDSLMAQRAELRSLQSRVARILYGAGIHANWATLSGGILGITAGILFAYDQSAVGVLALALSGGLDAADGTIAREFGQATALGGILDLTLNRVVEVTLLSFDVSQLPLVNNQLLNC
jgi:archaetidylinositol phosphate synthase